MTPVDEAGNWSGPGDVPEDEQSAMLPAYEEGGRVRETGLAIVHEGEYIVPAPGSEARIERDGASEPRVVNYFFPVQVEVVGQLDETLLAQLSDSIYRDLTSALELHG